MFGEYGLNTIARVRSGDLKAPVYSILCMQPFVIKTMVVYIVT